MDYFPAEFIKTWRSRTGPGKGRTALEIFWKQVNIGSEQECWKWTGYMRPDGYGHITVRYQDWPVHRFSWTIHNGDIPESLHVLHKCDVKNCVNPSHLYLGTPKDNALDRVARGQFQPLYGSDNGSSKLTEVEVIRIRKLNSSGDFTQAKLATMFGVCGQQISRIVNGQEWRHI